MVTYISLTIAHITAIAHYEM